MPGKHNRILAARLLLLILFTGSLCPARPERPGNMPGQQERTQRQQVGDASGWQISADPSFEKSAFAVFGAYALEYGWFQQRMGFSNEDYWRWVGDHFAKLGAHWTRSNLHLIWDKIEPVTGGGYNWNAPPFFTDEVVRHVYATPGVNWLGVFHSGNLAKRPVGTPDRTVPGRPSPPPPLRDPLKYPAEYAAFVKAAVKRYGGHAMNGTFPGAHVRYWQVGNEILEWGGSVDDYVAFVRLVRGAALAADPEARIVLIAPIAQPGNSGLNPFLNAVIERLAPRREFDVIDIHHWGTAQEWKIPGLDAWTRRLRELGLHHVELWSCENGTWAGAPTGQSFQTEEQQAQSLIKRYVWNLANGVSKLFWNNLVEWDTFGGNPGSIFNSMGLVSGGRTSGEPPSRLNTARASYWAYKTLASRIDVHRATLVGVIPGVHDERNIYAYEYVPADGAAHFYILWSEDGKRQVRLPVSGSPYRVTNLIADRLGNTLTTYSVEAKDGGITINVGQDPLLVEAAGKAGDMALIYVSIVMHSEEPPTDPDFVKDASIFRDQRAALIRFVNMLQRRGVRFNWEPDWTFLVAAQKFDDGSGTGGKNIARYIKEDMGFEVDPHAHETVYNYADVAYLLDALGVTPSKVVGGFLAGPPASAMVEYFRTPITGRQFPSYSWQAEILWGGALFQHVDEKGLWVSGIWRPRDNRNFLVHDPDAPLPHIGNFGLAWADLDTLIQMQQSRLLAPGRIYTATIFVPQSFLVRPNFIESFERDLRRRKILPDLRWVGLAELIEIWRTKFQSTPNILPYPGY